MQFPKHDHECDPAHQRCPRCDNCNDAAAPTGSSNPSNPPAGAVSICLYCNYLSVFTGEGTWTRDPTMEELQNFLEDPSIMESMVRARITRERLEKEGILEESA